MFDVIESNPRCARPGTVTTVWGWTPTAVTVSGKQCTRTEFREDAVTAYHNGTYIDFWFWKEPDLATAIRRARHFVADAGGRVVMDVAGKDTGQLVRVELQ
jgi:hypothetical protein